MAHNVKFTYNYPKSLCILTERELIDFVEMFYRWDDTNFNIVFEKKHKRWRGTAQWSAISREHTITLYVETIKSDAQLGVPVGGSQSAPSNSSKAAMAMVLAHEIQHCNQVKLHKQDAKSSFYGGHQYWNLASEREARGFTDERLNEICAYFNLPFTMRRAIASSGEDTAELQAVIELLSECDRVTSDDINDELRISNLSSPSNFSAVKRALQDKGLFISK